MRTSLFYVPHADDEALGMAGAIAAAKRRGDHVRLMLLSDNRPSARQRELFTGRKRCPLHRAAHDVGVDLATARMVELQASAAALGVDALEAIAIPEYMDHGSFVERVAELLLRDAARFPGAAHHLVSGARDSASTGRVSPSHDACAHAAAIAAPALATVTLHRIHVYALPLERRTADRVVALDDELMAVKCAALAAYQQWDPPARIGYGWHSVPELFEAAAADPHEYEDLVP